MTKDAYTDQIEFFGSVVEIGDDDDGQPRIVIHGTREQIRKAGALFCEGLCRFVGEVIAK